MGRKLNLSEMIGLLRLSIKARNWFQEMGRLWDIEIRLCSEAAEDIYSALDTASRSARSWMKLFHVEGRTITGTLWRYTEADHRIQVCTNSLAFEID